MSSTITTARRVASMEHETGRYYAMFETSYESNVSPKRLSEDCIGFGTLQQCATRALLLASQVPGGMLRDQARRLTASGYLRSWMRAFADPQRLRGTLPTKPSATALDQETWRLLCGKLELLPGTSAWRDAEMGRASFDIARAPDVAAWLVNTRKVSPYELFTRFDVERGPGHGVTRRTAIDNSCRPALFLLGRDGRGDDLIMAKGTHADLSGFLAIGHTSCVKAAYLEWLAGEVGRLGAHRAVALGKKVDEWFVRTNMSHATPQDRVAIGSTEAHAISRLLCRDLDRAVKPECKTGPDTAVVSVRELLDAIQTVPSAGALLATARLAP